MDEELKEAKQTIRAFMREHYTDERLSALLAHAQDGKLAFNSCCCFLGVLNAPHALAGYRERVGPDPTHHYLVRDLSGAPAAEHAFNGLGVDGVQRVETLTSEEQDAIRRRRLIPIIKAEMRRRERLRAERPCSVADGKAVCVSALESAGVAQAH